MRGKNTRLYTFLRETACTPFTKWVEQAVSLLDVIF